MSEVKHTPGPWHVGPHYKSDVESRQGRICECGPFGSEQAEANARLIAAAPELLDALKALAIDANRLCDRNLGGTYEEDCRRALEVAGAVIAKAEAR